MRESAPFSTTPHQSASGCQYTPMHVMCLHHLCCCTFRSVTGEGSRAGEALNDAAGSNHHQQKPWKDTGMCKTPHFGGFVHVPLLLPLPSSLSPSLSLLPPPSPPSLSLLPLQTFSREETLSSTTTEVGQFRMNPSDYHTTSSSHTCII